MNMSKRMLINGSLLLIILFFSFRSQPGLVKKTNPNIIFILVDDMRWDEFGNAGHPYIKTPNIDRLAVEGFKFTNAFCSTPLCSPSRASFLTGQYAHHHGIIDNTRRNERSHQLITFPKILHEAGYHTAFLGKWHMGNDDSPRPGFDFWAGMEGQGEAINPRLNINGKRQQVNGYVTDILNDYALRFIRAKRAAPFLLYLSHKALHPNIIQNDDGSIANIGEGGFIAADRHKGQYAKALFNRRPNAGIPPTDKPALMRKIGELPPLGATTSTEEQTIRDRAEMLLAVDESLGILLQELENMGQLDHTVIVMAGDNGYWYGEHGLNDERRLAYEEGIRIPLLIRYPGLPSKGVSIPSMVQNIDLAPTLLDMAGVKQKNNMDGRSLLPLMKGRKVSWRKSILIEYYSDIVFPRILNMGYKAIRTEKYKYIRYEELRGMDELYDLEADPFELKNLIVSPESMGVLTRMQTELNELIISK